MNKYEIKYIVHCYVTVYFSVICNSKAIKKCFCMSVKAENPSKVVTFY